MEIFIVVVMNDGSRMTETTSFDRTKRHDCRRAMQRAGVRFEQHRNDIVELVVFVGTYVAQYTKDEVAEIFGWEN